MIINSDLHNFEVNLLKNPQKTRIINNKTTYPEEEIDIEHENIQTISEKKKVRNTRQLS